MWPGSCVHRSSQGIEVASTGAGGLGFSIQGGFGLASACEVLDSGFGIWGMGCGGRGATGAVRGTDRALSRTANRRPACENTQPNLSQMSMVEDLGETRVFPAKS